VGQLFSDTPKNISYFLKIKAKSIYIQHPNSSIHRNILYKWKMRTHTQSKTDITSKSGATCSRVERNIVTGKNYIINLLSLNCYLFYLFKNLRGRGFFFWKDKMNFIKRGLKYVHSMSTYPPLKHKTKLVSQTKMLGPWPCYIHQTTPNERDKSQKQKQKSYMS
jgi:hypothetical protein